MYEAGNGHGNRFQKVEQMFDEWPTDNPLALFWGCKNSLSLCEMDHKRPCVLALKLFEMNGLSCVEINRLMHKLDVLT